MNHTLWNKLLALLEHLIMSRCRTRPEAEKLMRQLEDIRREVYSHDD